MRDRNILIVGATRGLGLALAEQYLHEGKNVYATARHDAPSRSSKIQWIPKIDITAENAGRLIAMQWAEESVDVLIICAGLFQKETLEDLNYAHQVDMYKTNAIGPIFLVNHLVTRGLLKPGSRIVLVGGESGSIGLRHEVGGGGNYGGHASKAALNMVGKLLSIDLKEKGVAVGIVHTGYLRRQNVDGSYESSGKDAVKPDEAATALRGWIGTFDMSKTGQFWSVRGPAGIKTAESVTGSSASSLPTPWQLPW